MLLKVAQELHVLTKRVESANHNSLIIDTRVTLVGGEV